jgi:cytochrome c oxidase subunit II
MQQSRRQWCLGAVCSVGGLLCGAAFNTRAGTDAAAQERIIKLEAHRFEYKPNRILLKKGELVVLEITSLDFVHGFNIPNLKIRADLPPGQLTKVRLVFNRAGEFDFLCDNFCGSGHEEMGGKIIVSA